MRVKPGINAVTYFDMESYFMFPINFQALS